MVQTKHSFQSSPTQRRTQMTKLSKRRISKELRQKLLEKERLIDDLMMSVFFDGDCANVQKMIRIILNRDDIIIKRVTTQKQLTNLRGRSVKLDILAVDSSNKMINIEFQRTKKGASPKRLRFNQSLLDANYLKKGQSPEKLPEIYIIMVLEKNHFKSDAPHQDIPIYHVIHSVQETGKDFDDGIHILYVNGEYRKDDPIGLLLQDLFESNPQKMNDTELAHKLNRLKYGEIENKENKNMNTALKAFRREVYNEGREEGRVEGRVEGREEGREEGRVEGREEGREEGCTQNAIQNVQALMESLNCDMNEAFRLLKISEDEKQKILNAMKTSAKSIKLKTK